MWLPNFLQYSEMTDFFSDFSVDGSIIVVFYWLFLWNFKKMALSEYMVVFVHQYTENICFFSKFSTGGLCGWGILLVISLKLQRDGQLKCLSHEFRQGENWRKRPYVHRAMEMKQPHAMTER